MKYNCTIISKSQEDEYEITVLIEDTYITGFDRFGTLKEIGDTTVVEITLFDDLKIVECDVKKVEIERKNKTFAYALFGILDIDEKVLRSAINFEIDKEILYDYGYLHGKYVRVDVRRIEFDFAE